MYTLLNQHLHHSTDSSVAPVGAGQFTSGLSKLSIKFRSSELFGRFVGIFEGTIYSINSPSEVNIND